jgi:hypothetical protein
MVSADGGSEFMAELLETVADAVRRAGGRARTAVGRYPVAERDTVYVVVPHEYFVVTPEADRPAAPLRARTIGFCVEHPGTQTFERTVETLASLGAAVDINRESCAELGRRGFAARHFQLGYSPLWDHWGGDPDRTRHVDVTYLGTAERRRSLLLRGYARDLDALAVRLLTPPHEPMGPARPDFLPGAAKFDHLADSRLLLNLHRERSTALEWVRVLEAMCNGCVVVTESSTDVDPLVPGEHLVVARPESLGAVAAALLDDPDRTRALRMAAYEFVRDQLDMRRSATALIETADAVLRRCPPTVPVAAPGGHRRTSTGPDRPLAVDTPAWDPRFAGVRSLGHEVTPAEATAAALAVERTAMARRAANRQWLEPTIGPLFAERARADVDVVLVQRPGEPDPGRLVRDLRTGTVLPARVLVCADGVIATSADRPDPLLLHEFPLGRATARNGLLARSAARWVLVLDAGCRAAPRLLERFLAAATADVAVVHCPVGDPVHGLVGALPPEDRRLRVLPYLGSGYLVSTELIDEFGGWDDDPLLDGVEDHVFWRRVAAGRHRSVLVQQVLLHRWPPQPPTRPLDLDPHRVWARVTALFD